MIVLCAHFFITPTYGSPKEKFKSIRDSFLHKIEKLSLKKFSPSYGRKIFSWIPYFWITHHKVERSLSHILLVEDKTASPVIQNMTKAWAYYHIIEMKFSQAKDLKKNIFERYAIYKEIEETQTKVQFLIENTNTHFIPSRQSSPEPSEDLEQSWKDFNESYQQQAYRLERSISLEEIAPYGVTENPFSTKRCPSHSLLDDDDLAY
jgi:hypothetical protein